MEQLSVALTGNPNTGKTTTFNMLTGARQHVANYPGVTIDIAEGRIEHNDTALTISDLPGTYSLAASSEDERVARNFLIEVPTDVVIDVVDATNLERNLYLALQLIEFGKPLVLSLNLSDAASRQGLEIDTTALSEALGVPCIPTVASKRQGRSALLDSAIEEVRRHRQMVGHHKHPSERNRVPYGEEIEAQIRSVQDHLIHSDLIGKDHPARWYALKLLEDDRQIIERYHLDEALAVAAKARAALEAHHGSDAASVIRARRLAVIAEICRRCVRTVGAQAVDHTERLDRVLTHPVLGMISFLAMMFVIFQAVFLLGAYPMEWLEEGFEALGGWVGSLWTDDGGLLRSLVVDGMITGVGEVLVFTPNILLLFLAIALLEASGYMSRAAFLMDRYMHRVGLHGKSFIPMLVGFGCTVPAIMATRILENRRDRLTTIMVLPLMSCGARIPIYALLIPCFFPPAWQGTVFFGLYCAGILLAIALAMLLKGTLLRGETPHFLLELPSYRRPALRDVAYFTGQRTWQYIKKAGTIILAAAVIIWALGTFPRLEHDEETMDEAAYQEAALRHSVIGRVGAGLQPIMAPAGFDERLTTAFIGASAAKEVFVTQMGIIFALGEIDPEDDDDDSSARAQLRARLRAEYPPLVGICVLLFALIGTPCVATLAITRRETRSWTWAIGQWVGLTLVAYLVAVLVYQIGSIWW